MAARNFATFDADVADDGKWSDTGDIITPAGRAVTERIVQRLKLLGRNATDYEQHSYYGWQFNVGSYWCLVQNPDSWLLIVEDRAPPLTSLFRKGASRKFEDFLEALNEALEGEPTISNIRWLTRREYENREQGRT